MSKKSTSFWGGHQMTESPDYPYDDLELEHAGIIAEIANWDMDRDGPLALLRHARALVGFLEFKVLNFKTLEDAQKFVRSQEGYSQYNEGYNPHNEEVWMRGEADEELVIIKNGDWWRVLVS